MKIAIYNLEPNYFNLALEKVKKFYIDKGEQVEDYFAFFNSEYNKIYASSIFSFTDKSTITPNMIVGGTGIDIRAKLPKEIDDIKIKMNKGFTTRGCIRKCPFCVVPEKEGNIKVVGDIYDIWDGKSKEIILYDNNILAVPEHFKSICEQLRKENIKVDFNQGLDIRLLNDSLTQLLKSVKHYEYKFSWDGKINLKQELIYVYKYLKKCTIFVLCGFNSTFEEDLEKFNIIKDIGHNGYCMRYETVRKDKRYIQLARWVNQHAMFNGYSYEDYLIADQKNRNIYFESEAK